MSRIHIQATGIVSAPAAEVYNLLADYRNGHPLVVPRKYFSDLTVEQGGVGAGTIVSFSVKAGGVTQQYRDVVSEPQPGRVLVESDTLSNTVTSFTVTPKGDNQCELEIATDFDASKGVRGFFEKLMAPAMMKRIYTQELEQIDQVASQRHATSKIVLQRMAQGIHCFGGANNASPPDTASARPICISNSSSTCCLLSSIFLMM